MKFLIAPTERAPFTLMGDHSSLPEDFGADILFESEKGELCGVQRKEYRDLIASVRDSRLGRELDQMVMLEHAMLVVEGRPVYDEAGNLRDSRLSWSLKQQRGVEWAAQLAGVWVCWTRDKHETAEAVHHWAEWISKTKHGSMRYRTRQGLGKEKDGWGRISEKSSAIHFLSGLPGIGTELAERIFDHFGKVPIGPTVSREELLEVDGLGPKKVDRLWKMFS